MAATGVLCTSATAAVAAGPDKEYFHDSGSVTDTALCGFEISVTYEVSGFDLLFHDAAGDLVRLESHTKETDTFSANGLTLVGEPYSSHHRLLFADGELIEYHVNGQLEKVRLPDGRLFLGAGRTDFLARTADVIVTPDHGVGKHVDALCAALSG